VETFRRGNVSTIEGKKMEDFRLPATAAYSTQINFSADEMAYLSPFYQAKKLGGESASDFARRALIVEAIKFRSETILNETISARMDTRLALDEAERLENLNSLKDQDDVIQELESAM
jgi:hypothetical protein